MTTTSSGRHKTIHAGTRVPTDRNHARCTCAPFVACPRHLPAMYAVDDAKHRSDRP